MSSLRKIEAARINGAKSHGPKTPEGKAISSMNALRHGLCAKALVLSNEDAEAFEAMRNSYLEEFQPVGAGELDLLDEMVAARWRQCRGWGVETAMIDLKMDQQGKSLEARYQRLDEATRTAIAYASLTDGNHSLDQIQRHDTRLSRMYRLALKTLVERQDRRKKENFQNEPNTAAQHPPADPPSAPVAADAPDTPLAPVPTNAQLNLQCFQSDPDTASQLPDEGALRFGHERPNELLDK
ncbi:MAG TPA: hypothetical protein VMZ52_02295 [Bryobacteraceae bacterium]|nr:hypothetical protein [Bryobacteraceae bacterium]